MTMVDIAFGALIAATLCCSGLLLIWSMRSRRVHRNDLKGLAGAQDEIQQLRQRILELETAINSPQIKNFLLGVQIEMPHQQVRWGVDHDHGKSPADWLWLVGYLAGARRSLRTPRHDGSMPRPSAPRRT